MRRMPLLLAIALLICAPALGCDSEPATDLPGFSEPQQLSELPMYATGPVARVDGEELGQKRFNEMAEASLEKKEADFDALSLELRRVAKEGWLNAIVNNHLVDRDLDQRQIVVESEEIEKTREHLERFMDDTWSTGLDHQIADEEVDRVAKIKRVLIDERDVELPDPDAGQSDYDLEVQVARVRYTNELVADADVELLRDNVETNIEMDPPPEPLDLDL